jgi:hypothetical protein
MVPNMMRLNRLKLRLGRFMYWILSTELAIQVANWRLLEMTFSSVD